MFSSCKFEVTCKLSFNLFLGKNKNNIINLSSADFDNRMTNVNKTYYDHDKHNDSCCYVVV